MIASETVEIPTAAQFVAGAIRKQIVLEELRDGDYLPPEPALIERYGVSRPTLREAMRILQSESLISIRRGSRGGARVNAPNIEPVARQAGQLLQHQRTTLGDVFRARMVIEPPAAGLLAERPSRATVQALRDALATEAAAMEDPVAFGNASAHFHELVVELAGNNTLALFSGIIAEIVDLHTTAVLLAANSGVRARDAVIAHRSHEKLLQHVTEGDAEAARAHWLAHMEATAESMLRGQSSKKLVDLYG
jgi:DNA-binding FadR family transcriptional regulator